MLPTPKMAYTRESTPVQLPLQPTFETFAAWMCWCCPPPEGPAQGSRTNAAAVAGCSRGSHHRKAAAASRPGEGAVTAVHSCLVSCWLLAVGPALSATQFRLDTLLQFVFVTGVAPTLTLTPSTVSSACSSGPAPRRHRVPTGECARAEIRRLGAMPQGALLLCMLVGGWVGSTEGSWGGDVPADGERRAKLTSHHGPKA